MGEKFVKDNYQHTFTDEWNQVALPVYKRLAVLGIGAGFGELALLRDNIPRMAAARAKTNTIVATLTR